MGIVWNIIIWLSPYALPSLTLLYPFYASIKAIESSRKDDDHQWLSYWIIYSFLMLFEFAAEHVLKWLPFWPVVKVLFACWLVLPQFKGASHVYERFLQPHVLHLLREEEKVVVHQFKVLQSSVFGSQKTTVQTSKGKPFTRKQASFKRTAKVRKRSTRKFLELFGMNNLGS